MDAALQDFEVSAVRGARRSSTPSARSRPGLAQPISDEDAATRSNRDVVTRARLQSHARHERHGHWTARRGDEGIVANLKTLSRRRTAQNGKAMRQDRSEPGKPPNHQNARPEPRSGRSGPARVGGGEARPTMRSRPHRRRERRRYKAAGRYPRRPHGRSRPPRRLRGSAGQTWCRAGCPP
jgi:hypothetical protein